MIRLKTLTCITIALAGAAAAHTGVKNAAVKARMHTMSEIGAEMKTIGQMAKGETAFNLDSARAAAAAIARHAAATPALFIEPADDPKSEAQPAIWTDFEDFTAKAAGLEDVATGLSTSINTSDDLPGAVKSLGQACKACHKTYRE